jgi:hypothetical protein
VLTFAHTLGEFGVVLMVGGSIPGETRTLAIAIYDRVQAFDDAGAAHVGPAAGVLAGHHRPDLRLAGGASGGASDDRRRRPRGVAAQETPIPLAAEFACAPGEVLALVGPSGSGKTTILRASPASTGRPAAASRRRRDLVRPRARPSPADPAPPGRGHGVPELRAVSPHDRAGNVMAALGHLAADRGQGAPASCSTSCI